MATVHLSLSQVKGRANTGATMPVIDSQEQGAETLTSSGQSQMSDLSATTTDQFWTVTAVGGPVFVKFGANPVAGPDTGHLIPEGMCNFAVTKVGEKCAVVDA